MLETYILNSPMWRSHSLPAYETNRVIVTHASEIPYLGTFLKPSNARMVARIALVDYNQSLGDRILIQEEGSEPVPIKILTSGLKNKFINCEFILFCHNYRYENFLSGHRYMQNNGIRSFFVAMPYMHGEGMKTTFLPDYLSRNRHELDEVFGLLADEQSRLVFAARIRALVTGNIGYLPISEFPQYFHPMVGPRTGDVVMDGGVSEYCHEQASIAEAVGPEGRIFGFEPDKTGFAKASEALNRQQVCANYRLLPYGLWNKKEIVRFTPLGVGSHVGAQDGCEAVDVQMTSIDQTVSEQGLDSVDFIKLDIEGSEENALHGAVRTITRFRPRLAISAYHKPHDLFALPLLIKKLHKKYRFYLGHHHPTLFDTVLYAVAE